MTSKEALEQWCKSVALHQTCEIEAAWDACLEWVRGEATKACQDKEEELKLCKALCPLVNDVPSWPFVETIRERLK